MNVYKRLYFGFFKLLLRAPDPETADWMAFIYLAILFALNIMSIMLGYGFRYTDYFSSAWPYALLFMIPLVTFNYYYLHKNSMNKELRAQFRHHQQEDLTTDERVAITYLIISLIAPFIARLIR